MTFVHSGGHMGAHAGLLSVEGIADAEAMLEIHRESLRLYVERNLIGEWPRIEAAIDTMPDHLRITVEGYSFVFRARDHWLLVFDLQGRHSHLAIRVAEVRSPAPERERRLKPKLQLGWLGPSVGLALLILVGLSALFSQVEPSGAEVTNTTQGQVTSTTTLPPAPVAALAAPLAAEDGLGMVISITDGDTFRVLLSDGREEPVRLIGIDAAEPGQPSSEESAAMLELLIGGKQVRLVVDNNDRDRFDRLLRYVYVGETFVNQELVRAGLAIARRYPPDVAMAEVLESAESEARQEGLGVWALASTTLATTTSAPGPTPTTKATAITTDPGCHPSYPDFCIPPPPPDLGCKDISTKNFTVRPPDPHRFDGDEDGIGCES